MNVSPIAKILTTTAIAWLVASASHAQESPAGRSRAEVDAEAIAVAHAPDQNVNSSARINSKVVSTMPPNPAQLRAEAAQRKKTQ